MAPSSSFNDALIVGGGHADLSAALTLYRALHTSIIFGAHRLCNWQSSPVRLTPTWENQDPEKFREAARAELCESGLCRFVDTGVDRVEKLDNGIFQAVDTSGEIWLGRKLLFATGMEDVFPTLDGYVENYPTRMFLPLHV